MAFSDNYFCRSYCLTTAVSAFAGSSFGVNRRRNAGIVTGILDEEIAGDNAATAGVRQEGVTIGFRVHISLERANGGHP